MSYLKNKLLYLYWIVWVDMDWFSYLIGSLTAFFAAFLYYAITYGGISYFSFIGMIVSILLIFRKRK